MKSTKETPGYVSIKHYITVLYDYKIITNV